MTSIIDEPQLDTFDDWMKLAEGTGDIKLRGIVYKDGHYKMSSVHHGYGNGVSASLVVKKSVLSEPLKKMLIEAKGKNLDFAK